MKSLERQAENSKLRQLNFAIWMILAGFLAMICGCIGFVLLDTASYWGEFALAMLAIPLLPVVVFVLLLAALIASPRWKNTKWSGRIYIGILLVAMIGGPVSGEKNGYAWAVLAIGVTAAFFFWHSVLLDRLHNTSLAGAK